MKITTTTTVTEIECTADDLRQSTTLADGLYNALRGAFNGPIRNCTEEQSEEANL